QPARDHAPLALDRARRGALIARVEAYEIVRPPHAFYAGRTAIALYDRLFDDDPCEARLDVAVLAPARAPRMKGVRGIQLAPHLVTVRIVDGRPVASPASVWAQLAGELDVVGLVRLGDALVRVPRGDRGVPQPAKQLATIAQLKAAADARGRRGRARLHEALALIRVGSMSTLETDFHLAARACGLPEPELDVEIRGAGGRLVGIADALYREYAVIVEVEGQHHRTNAAQWERDIEKHAAYAQLGYALVRVTQRQIDDGRAAARVLEALRHRGWMG
ncbi:MAG TPA: hypothetical protein VEP72_07835, partial [Microbacterium sp.]|nr:hypothetical protein [Microbacterium sp.]